MRFASILAILWTVQISLATYTGWKEFNGTYYLVKFGDPKLDFFGAERNCQENGGHLASIHSAEENQFIMELAKTVFPPDVEGIDDDQIFFGLRQEGANKQWKYTDNRPFYYMHWATIQPDDFEGRQHCTIIIGPDRTIMFREVPMTSSQWDDISCFTPLLSHVCTKT